MREGNKGDRNVTSSTRPKHVIARARKKSAAAGTRSSEPTAQAAPVQSPDASPEAVAAGMPPKAADAHVAERPPATFVALAKRPDPFGEWAIALTGEKDGPKARLYRNQRFQHMAIRFDEKPDEDIRHRLREAGWTWRGQEGAWTRQLGERPGDAHRQARALFEGIANDVRRANGLELVTASAQSR